MGDIGLELNLEVKTGFSIAKVWSMYYGGGKAQLNTVQMSVAYSQYSEQPFH